jgi:hypothetical protein
MDIFDIEIIQELNYQEYIKNKYFKNYIPKKIVTIFDSYPDFKWDNYRDLNPFLYINGLRTEKEYIHNFLVEGRYVGRIYKPNKKYSFHVLLTTIGKNSIFNILSMLGKQLISIDYLTIVYDGINNTLNIEQVKNFVKLFQANIKIIVEKENLGYWGHGIRNKYNNLEGDFIYHVDDDDILFDDTFDNIRKHCKDINTIYLFKIMLENGKIIWKKKDFIYSTISTQSGIIPSHINKNGYWELKYGGDFDFYVHLCKNYNFLFIDKIIYRKLGDIKLKNK